ncbi:presqualene diphosphate phosphatase, putative [Pediculus humanus corporis]|uniref:Presqualene diphosphate phosphatase, putative n=1 Tax=Pediculus humanus subsp. corporis TaxID=121224 RepID=E0VT09_PEDHC|nr:presqualene diphosphate phosphatase, putative [Pediculus humanus corporis]EEB16515.1 presqualene diphosphate phosphatase, putative [Pediculus humanus corporis]
MAKRKVPGLLRRILNQDEKLTEKFCLFMNKFLPFRQLRVHHKALEITCHGAAWLAGWLIFIYLINSPKLYQMQVNFYIGLILDIIFVAILKAYTRRKRPSGNTPDMFLTIGVDKFSFPSGHASRVTFIALFFMFLYPLPIFCFPPLMAWLVSLSISRILMKRHHILDVLGGILLGIVETFILSLLWLSKESSATILSFMNEENLED